MSTTSLCSQIRCAEFNTEILFKIYIYIYICNQIQYPFILQHASLSHTTCTLTETTTGTLTRPGGGFGIVPDRISGSIPFENGHVTHLDLAAVHPRIVGSNHHLHGHGGHSHSDHTIGGGGFMTSSLSAAALNASSWYLSCCIKFVNSYSRLKFENNQKNLHSSQGAKDGSDYLTY